MPKGNTFINDYLKLIFNGTAIANIADNAASAPLTSYYLALHTADPTASGNQTSSEASYSGYGRQAVARNSGGFTVTSTSVTLTSAVSFPQAPSTATDVLKFWSVGTASTGTGKIEYFGAIGTNLGAGIGQSGNNIIIPGSTLAVDDRVTFEVPTGGTIPTGLTAGTVYYVKTASGDTITVSTTSGGSAVVISADGQLLCFKDTPITLGGGLLTTPTLGTGTTITEL